MDINRANLEVLFQNFRVEWTAAFNAEKERTIQDRIAMTVPSTGSSVLHAWLKQIPVMREWVGDRVVNNIESNSITVNNRKYENTIEMPREDIEDDQYGLYTPLVRNMAAEAAANPDKLLTTTLVTNDTWGGDSANFFSDATRSFDGTNTIDNYVTSALSASTFETAYQKMSSYIGHKGEPLMVRPYALLVGPKNRVNAWNILKSGLAALGTGDATTTNVTGENANAGIVDVYESKRLVGTYDDYWFLLGEVGGIRGLVYQDRMAAEFQTARFDNNSDFVFETDKYQMGTRARGAAFKALPHLIYAGYVA